MITIYTLENCPRCEEIKKMLKKDNVQFTVRSMEDPEALTDLRFGGYFRSEAPVIEIDGSYYTYEEFMNTKEE